MKWSALLVLATTGLAAAEPPKLELVREPPPRHLHMRPRSAAATGTGGGTTTTARPAKPAKPVPAPTPAARVERAVDAGSDAALVRDLRKPVSVRINLGYAVDGTTLSGKKTLGDHELGLRADGRTFEFAQLRAYAIGETFLSTRGVVLQSLSSYFAARFQLVQKIRDFDPNDPAPLKQEVAPPIANWFDRSGVEPRAVWAEVKDFLPDRRLAPLRLRAGELYVYGPWVLHMYGATTSWDGKLVHLGFYGGSRVPDYTLVDVLAKDRAGIGGTSLKIDLRDLKNPIPFTVSAEALAFTAAGAANNQSSNHALVQLDWRPRRDVALIGQARTLDGKLANEHVQLRSRYKQVTNLVFDLTYRNRKDWRWDPSVTDPDPLQPKRRLDLGPVLPQLLVSGRAGTLFRENVDVYARGAVAADLSSSQDVPSTYSASYVELGGAIELRLRRTIALGASATTRQTKRAATVAGEIPDHPGVIDAIPSQTSAVMGERGFVELGSSLKMTLGARRFSALVEAYGRRTKYALDYCKVTDPIDDRCMSAADTGIQSSDVRLGTRITVDAWIGQRLRLFAAYEFSSQLDYAPEITGYKSLRLIMEGVY